jgi:hypothetical protein
MILRLMQSSFLRKTAVDKICKVIHELVLPQPNWFPPSLYLMEQIIRVPAADLFEWHACPAEQCCWPPLPRSQWEAHKDDRCKHGKRFMTDSKTVAQKPVKVGAAGLYIFQHALL